MPTESRVTKHGIEGIRPDRDATVGVNIDGPRNGRRGEQPMVPDATFTSYYGRPILKQPSWKARDIAGYFFLGGVAGTASMIAAGADLTHRPQLARVAKLGAAGSIALGMAGLVHDLGKPARFVNMLRVFKPTSPMNVGSWLLAAYTPAAMMSAASGATGRMRQLGAAATFGAAALGPVVASYTGGLLSDTAVPAWHDAFRELPFLFVSSAAAGGAGFALAAGPARELGPARRLAAVAAVGDVVASRAMERRGGTSAEPYRTGRAGSYMRAARMLALAGAAGATLSGHHRVVARASGVALLAGSLCTKLGVFEAGRTSASDPKYTVAPQRARLAERLDDPSAGERA